MVGLCVIYRVIYKYNIHVVYNMKIGLKFIFKINKYWFSKRYIYMYVYIYTCVLFMGGSTDT